MGPWVGWMNGWAIFVADVIVMASLAVIASTYTYILFDWTAARERETADPRRLGVWISLMTWICCRGIELSARVQQFLLAAEILVLAAFAIAAFYKVYASIPLTRCTSAPTGSTRSRSGQPLFDGVLLGIFIYWGWDSGVAVNEETEGAAESPGKAAVLSTLILLADLPPRLGGSPGVCGTGFLDRPIRTRS